MYLKRKSSLFGRPILSGKSLLEVGQLVISSCLFVYFAQLDVEPHTFHDKHHLLTHIRVRQRSVVECFSCSHANQIMWLMEKLCVILKTNKQTNKRLFWCPSPRQPGEQMGDTHPARDFFKGYLEINEKHKTTRGLSMQADVCGEFFLRAVWSISLCAKNIISPPLQTLSSFSQHLLRTTLLLPLLSPLSRQQKID